MGSLGVGLLGCAASHTNLPHAPRAATTTRPAPEEPPLAASVRAWDELESARSAAVRGDLEARRAHLRLAERALERDTGARSAPFVITGRVELEPGLQRVSVIPDAGGSSELVFAARRTGAAPEPVRLVASALLLGEGRALLSDGAVVRALDANGVKDAPVGSFRLPDVTLGAPGSRYAVACDAGGMHLVDRHTARVESELATRCGTLRLVGDRRLLDYGEGSARVLELPSLRVLGSFETFGPLADLVLDKSGARAALSEGDRFADTIVIRVIDLEHGRQLRAFERPQPAPTQIALSPDGRRLLLVDEQAEVVDVDTGARHALGGRAFYPFRPGSFARYGWSDLIDPPAGTGRVAVFDDGRACIEQGGTPVVVPRSEGDHCWIGGDGAPERLRVRRSGGTRWVVPKRNEDTAQTTVRLAPDGTLLVVEAAPGPSGAQFLVGYDRSSGRERSRVRLAPSDRPTLVGFDAGAALIESGANEHEPGTFRRYGAAQDEGEALEEAPVTPWLMPEPRGGTLVVREQPRGATVRWDVRTLTALPEGAPEPATLPASVAWAPASDTLASTLLRVVGGAPAPWAAVVPIGEGLVVMFADGRYRLIGVRPDHPDLGCRFGAVVAPLEVCASHEDAAASLVP